MDAKQTISSQNSRRYTVVTAYVLIYSKKTYKKLKNCHNFPCKWYAILSLPGTN